MAEQTDERLAYQDFLVAAAAALGPDEFWCVFHPDGQPLDATASKLVVEPIRRFCDALNMDWDDATDAGFRIGKIQKDPTNDRK